MIQTAIKYIYCGKEKEINDGKRETYRSSYQKNLVDINEDLSINKFGFLNDTQSDKKHHGGIDKAICVYSHQYYNFFKEKYQLDLPNCAFGENLTIVDLNDSDICLGDQFKCGEVIFEVSQPRQPCWKISSIIGIKKLTSLIVKEHKSGFYFRVIKDGKMNINDKLELIARDNPKITIEFINQCAFNAKDNQDNIKEILECNKLALSYRESLSRRYKCKEQGIQDWQEDRYNSPNQITKPRDCEFSPKQALFRACLSWLFF